MDNIQELVYTENSRKYFKFKKVLDLVFIPIFGLSILASIFFMIFLPIIKVTGFSIYFSLGIILAFNGLYLYLSIKELVRLKTVKIVINSSGAFMQKFPSPVKKYNKLSLPTLFNLILAGLALVALVLNIVFVSLTFTWSLLVSALFIFVLFTLCIYILLESMVTEKMNNQAIDEMENKNKKV